MPHSVPRLGRALDLVGLALFLAGAGCYMYAQRGMDGIRTGQTVITGSLFATLNQAKAYSRVADLGLALAVVGLMVFGAAFMVARRARTGPPAGA
jgi:hypothetical protein